MILPALIFLGLAICGAVLGCWLQRRAQLRRAKLVQAQKRDTAAAAHARLNAENASAAKSRFLATVSHEVRTPLAGILGMADLLAATGLSGEQAAYAQAIRSCGTALSCLIDDILDFSKIEAGKLELQAAPFDLVTLVEGVVELLAPRAQGKGLEIAALIAPEIQTQLVGDAARLRQILINLIGNSVKFTALGGVGLEVTVAAGRLEFHVRDTGCGVPEARREVIFEEFEQADAMVAQHSGGTGLGLAIARRIAAAMGGTLELARTGVGGSDFCCSVPLRVATGDAEACLPPLPAPRRVLLVMAQAIFEAPFLAARLEALGMAAVVETGTGAALARIAGLPPPDVVIVDCALGQAATQLLVEAARAAGAGRVLVLFSPFERRAFGQSLANGAQGWLVKPLRTQSLLACLNGIAPSPHAQPATNAVPAATGQAILLAEDNDINALVATRQLERLGATVIHARDGLSALALARRALLGESAGFDLILMDLHMPGMDGRDVTRALRRLEAELARPPMRIVALTADAQDGDGHANRDAGFDDCLVKPVDFDRLAQVVAGTAAIRQRA